MWFAQTSRPDVWEKALPILWVGFGLILAAVVFGAAIIWWRRRSLADEPTPGEVWTLDDLRRMRAEGSLTEDEYQRLRETMIAAYKSRVAKSPEADSSPEKRV
ncbi:MAG TPA: hypothetical protein PLL20_03585 [Phycisphaerae bacterium]|nr:hypothetical protein [Phycisphaerae bacterium]HRR84306.1 hypothetical protein [Phycisphaerae bacterium]